MMDAWNTLKFNKKIKKGLEKLNFTQPTNIQSKTIPDAIQGKDIIGAAETGSGKTLCFGIPIINGILKSKKEDKEESDVLYALILAPTRELAVQIKEHLDAVHKFTSIKSCLLIGGMSEEKQERLLNRCPEIIIGTPGRVWHFYQKENHHLLKIDAIKYLAIDETDRMLEKGHFEDLQNILEVLNTEDLDNNRQTFVFSATLTMIHELPQRVLMKKKRVKKLTADRKLNRFISVIGMKGKPLIVDLTPSTGTAVSLKETKLNCSDREKELYLYYFLKYHPGRTLVFCNSINAIVRLQRLFKVLQFEALAITGKMKQKSRLSNIEKFVRIKDSLLFATDVAARGLDMPSVHYVVHYEVPKTAETYVHRSGRSARAGNEGLSLIFISPNECSRYTQVMKTLNKKELKTFSVNYYELKPLKANMSMAKEIELAEFRNIKSSDNKKLKRKFSEVDVDSDENISDCDERAIVEMKKKKERIMLKQKKLNLKKILERNSVKEKFPYTIIY